LIYRAAGGAKAFAEELAKIAGIIRISGGDMDFFPVIVQTIIRERPSE